ncbi:MAG: zinc-ribbon domain-containing protein, partial [Methanomicrobia archaeon]|nr:zinc-ribbon domain-containing protein [Methanomicrobia archaeon]
SESIKLAVEYYKNTNKTKIIEEKISYQVPEETWLKLKHMLLKNGVLGEMMTFKSKRLEKDNVICPVQNRRIDIGEEVFQCPSCGAYYHIECAQVFVDPGFCSNCGKKLPIEEKIRCPHCGTKIEIMKGIKYLRCPTCLYLIEPSKGQASEGVSSGLQRLLQEKAEWRKKLEDLKREKEDLIRRGVMTEEYYQQRYEEIINKLVDIEDKIIQEKIKGGKKK